MSGHEDEQPRTRSNRPAWKDALRRALQKKKPPREKAPDEPRDEEPEGEPTPKD